jgi:hypothetical protein
MSFSPFIRVATLTLASVAFSAELLAATPATSAVAGAQSQSSMVLPPADTQWQGSLGLTSLSYANGVEGMQRAQFSVARFTGQFSRIGNELEMQADLRLGIGVDCGSACSSIESSQLSIGSSRRLGPVSFHLGRVMVPWSTLDDEWALGVFQPRFIYDFLHPQRVGLAGGFVRVQARDFRLTFFASPGFIPDRGLPVNVENGRIGSIDPFFHAPIQEVIYEGRTTPIAYRLVRGSLSEMLMRPAMGVTSQVGGEQGWGASASYAYKPVNQVLLAYNNLYNLSFEVADADIFPRIVMHHVASADLRYSANGATASLSVIREVPIMDRVPVEWTAQQLSPAWLISPQVSWRGEKTFQASASYLRIEGGNAPDLRASNGPKVTEGASVFNPRYPFTNAVRLSAGDLLWRSGQKSLTWRSQIIMDLEHAAQAYLHSVAYQPNASWQARLATDILVSSNAGTDFISRNRANDRFFGAVSYVF